MTKNQWLTIEMVSRHVFEVMTQNAVESKTAKSRHGTEVATQEFVKGSEKRGRNKYQHSWQQK